jgi:hypothetical protein
MLEHSRLCKTACLELVKLVVMGASSPSSRPNCLPTTSQVVIRRVRYEFIPSGMHIGDRGCVNYHRAGALQAPNLLPNFYTCRATVALNSQELLAGGGN